MKLSWVKFRSIERFDDGTSGNEAFDAMHSHMDFDPEQQIITVGTRCFPAANVQAFVKVPCDPCPECKEMFNGPTATAAHRRFAHGVLGKRAQKEQNK